MIHKGICIVCGKGFVYVRYRADKNYCSKSCTNSRYYDSRRKHRQRMSPEQWKEHKRNYDRQYIQQPEVREKRNERSRARYATDEYRSYARSRYYAHMGHSLAPLNHAYTEHRWFDLVRRHVGEPPAEDSVFFDKWADRMGAAVVALLEGQDIDEAIREHNRKEYIPENRTIFLGDWKDDEEQQARERLIPSVESAEAEALAKEAVTYQIKTRYSYGKNNRRFGKAGSHRGRIQPSRREGYKEYQDKPGARR